MGNKGKEVNNLCCIQMIDYEAMKIAFWRHINNEIVYIQILMTHEAQMSINQMWNT